VRLIESVFTRKQMSDHYQM